MEEPSDVVCGTVWELKEGNNKCQDYREAFLEEVDLIGVARLRKIRKAHTV